MKDHQNLRNCQPVKWPLLRIRCGADCRGKHAQNRHDIKPIKPNIGRNIDRENGATWGSWFLVLGSWFLVLGSWFLVLGSWLFATNK
ncbi:hypothetical protein A9Q96_13095 [Rhodobacterales bacterium 52_120_T64]|nr:hypothetical protein A9Q96_13095 [Rhodobacterales bacterium 52_120_T64]